MMKIYRKLLVILILLFPTPIFSQLLKQGYIITTQNDTLRGFIKENPDNKLVRLLFFAKENDPSQLVKYELHQLKEFGFNSGRIFENLLVNEFVVKDSVAIQYPAKRILTGKIIVYTIEEKGKETELLLKNQATGRIVHPKEPKMRELVGSDGRSTFTIDSNYLQLIADIKKDTPSDLTKQDDFKYSTKKIIRNIKKYNLVYQDKFAIHQYKEQVQMSYGLLGGTYAFSQPRLGSPAFKGGYRFSGFIDYNSFEKTGFVAFTQGFSYSKFKMFHTLRSATTNIVDSYYSNNEIMSIYPAGIKFQGYRKAFTPYIYTAIGVTCESERSYAHTKEVKIGFNMGAGAKIKIASTLFIVAELSFKSTEGFYANSGIVYQHIRREKQYSRFVKEKNS